LDEQSSLVSEKDMLISQNLSLSRLNEKRWKALEVTEQRRSTGETKDERKVSFETILDATKSEELELTKDA